MLSAGDTICATRARTRSRRNRPNSESHCRGLGCPFGEASLSASMKGISFPLGGLGQQPWYVRDKVLDSTPSDDGGCVGNDSTSTSTNKTL